MLIFSTPEPLHSRRSVDVARLVVPRSWPLNNSERALVVHAPRLWNTLPTEIRQVTSLSFLKLSFIKKLLCMSNTSTGFYTP